MRPDDEPLRPDERFREVAAILAAGVLRLRTCPTFRLLLQMFRQAKILQIPQSTSLISCALLNSRPSVRLKRLNVSREIELRTKT